MPPMSEPPVWPPVSVVGCNTGAVNPRRELLPLEEPDSKPPLSPQLSNERRFGAGCLEKRAAGAKCIVKPCQG